ncbi:MAG: glycoside hydrolase [Thaumarchaeota archaeon]|nr:glycoside hydrolase [Nitrososphaerota archaeon]
MSSKPKALPVFLMTALLLFGIPVFLNLWFVSGLATPGESTSIVSAAFSSSSVTYRESKVSTVSQACNSKSNAEVEQVVDPVLHYVYELWMGCTGIGFARSTDGGFHFEPAISLKETGGTANSWDPALTVSSSGIVYTAFMRFWNGFTFPVVEASFDHGKSFSQVSFLIPPKHNNWGDRDFIAVSPHGRIYVTWDYGPSAKAIKYICSPGGSCAFLAGDLNAVIQWSDDGGKTWSKIVPINPNFPAGGGDSAPLVVEPNGRVDVLYQGYKVTNPKNFTLAPAHPFFTYSPDGGQTWAKPVRVGPAHPTMDLVEWWIDGALSTDAAGNLYATWDTQANLQGTGQDIGWLAYSIDHGLTWSAPARMTPDNDHAAHIIEVAGGSSGLAYVGWLSNSSSGRWTQYMTVFKIGMGVITPIIQVSKFSGNPNVWPGDTFGISTLSENDVVISWGGAIPGSNQKSQIFTAVLDFTFS